MKLYLTNLCEVLDIETPNWRSNSVILLDGASPHVSSDTIDHIKKKLKIPVIFTGPYSYDAAAIELFFAYFKRTILASLDQTYGKKAFKEIIQFTALRICNMRKSSFVMFFRHVVLNMFQYLMFYKL